MAFSRQEHWSELPSPSPGDLPDPGIEPEYLSFQVDSLPSEPPESESESHSVVSNSFGPHGRYSLWNSPGHNTGVGSHSLLQGNLPNLGIKPRSPTLQVDFFLPAEPPGKPYLHAGMRL